MSIVDDITEKKNAMEILLNHLEENPEPIKKRNLSSERIFDAIGILKLEIKSIYGKKGK